MRADCGPEALRALAAHHGIATTLAEARHLTGASGTNGVSLADLAKAARALGLDAQAVKDAPLEGLPFPAVVHLDGNHWQYADAPTPSLSRRFTGYALVVLP